MRERERVTLLDIYINDRLGTVVVWVWFFICIAHKNSLALAVENQNIYGIRNSRYLIWKPCRK